MPGALRRRELAGNTFIVTHFIDDSHAGWRADLYLRANYRSKSRNQLQKAIDDGRISLVGRKLKASTRLQIGDELKLFTEKTTEPVVDFNYKVLFEDDHVLVIDKPGNLPVHPAGRFLFNTLLMRLREERRSWVDTALGRDFYLIHRLDRETSGVIVLAKTQKAAGALVKQFRERKTVKKYYAVARGDIDGTKHGGKRDHFDVDCDIGPAKGSEIRLRMGPYPKGTEHERPETGAQSSHTRFRVLKRKGDRTLVECELFTGRQHQIRVHLAHVGHPVLGDKLYSGNEDIFLHYIENGGLAPGMLERLGFVRHALHSAFLSIAHPVTGKLLEISTPVPPEFEKEFA